MHSSVAIRNYYLIINNLADSKATLKRYDVASKKCGRVIWFIDKKCVMVNENMFFFQCFLQCQYIVT